MTRPKTVNSVEIQQEFSHNSDRECETDEERENPKTYSLDQRAHEPTATASEVSKMCSPDWRMQQIAYGNSMHIGR